MAISGFGGSPGGISLGTAANADLSFAAGALDRMYIQASSGNVGIGTTNPGAKLAIFDGTSGPNIHIDGVSAQPHFISFRDSGTEVGFIGLGSGSNRDMYVSAGTGNMIRFGSNGTQGQMVLNSGNVGIGTTSPLSVDGGAATKFHIDNGAGTGNIEVARFEGGSDADNTYGVVRVGHANDRGFFVKGGREVGDTPIATMGLTSAGGAMTDIMTFKSGNVGIGTTNPLTKLEIKGASAGTVYNGQLQISASETTGAVDTGGGIAFYGHNGSAERNLGGIQLNKENSIIGDNLSYFRISTRNAAGLGERFRINSDGNVGIGTTAPGDTLTVKPGVLAGGITIKGFDETYTAIQLQGYTSTGVINMFSGGSSKIRFSASGDSYINSGNVGIGTTSPGAKLDVSGVTYNTAPGVLIQGTSANTSLMNDYGALTFVNTDQTANNYTGFMFSDNANGANAAAGMYTVLTNHASNYGDYAFLTRGADGYIERMRIQSTGNVGIGTTNPGAKLDVAGNIYFGLNILSGQYYYGPTDTNTYFSASGTADTYVGTVGRNVIFNRGNVGIGTTSPFERLDVNGTNPRIYLADSSAPATTANRLYSVSGNLTWNGINLTGGGALPSGTTGQTLWNNAGTWTATSNLFNDGTNVGIGTTNPTQQLEITGNFKLPTTTATTGIIYSGASTLLHAYGTNNAFIGAGAGNFTLTGAGNVALGYQALTADAEGGVNTAIGYQALSSNTSGAGNLAIGYQALHSNTFGSNMVAIGYQALYSSDASTYSSAVGYQALYNNMGAFNTGMGYTVMQRNAFGGSNTAVGYQALVFNTSGGGNAAFGVNAGLGVENNSHSGNTFIGANSGYGVTTGGSNAYLGYQSGFTGTTAANNVALGVDAGYSNSTGAGNVFLGYKAGYNETGSNKLWIANSDTTSLIYGDFATGMVGIGGTAASTSPYLYIASGGNVGIGTTAPNAPLQVVSGTINYLTFDPILTNTLVGRNAGNLTMTGSYNSAQGELALFSNTTGLANSAQGFNALKKNTTGSYNSAQGASALFKNTTGSYNSAQGVYALYNLTDLYDKNTAVGYNAGRYSNGTAGNLTAISNSLFLGAETSALNATGDTNETVIGYNAIGNGSNTITLGGSGVTSTLIPYGNVGIGTTAPVGLLSVSGSSTNATAGDEYANYISFSDTGAVASGTDNTYGQYINVSRTGAAGGTANAYGQYINVTGDTGTTSVTGSDVEINQLFSSSAVSQTGYFAQVVGYSNSVQTNYGFHATVLDGTNDTSYGAYLQVYSSGLNTTEYGVYSDVSGGTNGISYGIYSNVQGLGTKYAGVFMGGNVGIGTTSPGTRLNVYSSGTSTDVFRINASDGTSVFEVTEGSDGRGYAGIKDTSGVRQILLDTAGVSYFNGGNVGIGTTNPDNLLQVAGLIDFNNTDYSTKIGYQAGLNIVSGAQFNTFVGYQAGFSSAGGSTNTADFNTGVGSQTLSSNTTGRHNNAFGHYALNANTEGSCNNAFGGYTLQQNTTGSFNTAFGDENLISNTDGQFNAVFGDESLVANQHGTYNSTLGSQVLTTNQGSYNTAVGAESGGTGSYNVYLGYAAGKTASGDNQLWVANSSTTSLIYGDFSTGMVGIGGTAASTSPYLYVAAGGNVGIGTTGPGYKLEVNTGTASGYVVTATGAWGNTSDERLKKNIDPMGPALSSVMALNPVTYNLKTESNSDPAHAGFIAQEVERISSDLVTTGPNGYKGISYAMFTPLLTKAIQEQQGQIGDLQAQSSNLKTQNDSLNLKISESANTISDLQTAVNDKLEIISNSLALTDAKLTDGEASFADLKTRLAAAETKLQTDENNLAAFESSTTDLLSSMMDTENMLTEKILNHEDRIKALEDKLAAMTIPAGGTIPANVITQDASGNVTLAGVFQAKVVQTDGVVAGSYAVKNDEASPTAGEGKIVAVKTEKDNDGWDDETKVDGKSARITTDAVSETAKIFITFEDDPGARYWVEKITDPKTGELTNTFSVNVSDSVKKDTKFSWWIVESKN